MAINSVRRDCRISQPPRTLHGQHLILLAIGASIRTSLFVSSGKALAAGGPATLLVNGFITAAMVYAALDALSEMTAADPCPASFIAYSSRYLDPAWGFALGWSCAIQSLTLIPLELIATSETIKVWMSAGNDTIRVGICLTVLFLLTFLGNRGIVNTLTSLAAIKSLAIIVLCVVGLVYILGGGPDHHFIGDQYWLVPGPFNNGFLGFSSVLVFSLFPLAGLEILGLAASETTNPAKTFPRSARVTFWILMSLHLTTFLIIGFLVPYTDIRLVENPTNYEVNASPFIIAMNAAPLLGFKIWFNSIIIITTFSTAASSLYASSRLLFGLAKLHYAPIFLDYTDQRGRPTTALLVGLGFSLLAFVVMSPQADMLFGWILSFSGTSSVFVWASICLAHIRFRKGLAKHGHLPTQLSYRSPLGTKGSWFGLLYNTTVLVCQIWTCARSNVYTDSASIQLVGSFLASYLYVLVILFLYIGSKFWFRSTIVRSSSMQYNGLDLIHAGDVQTSEVVLPTLQ